MEVKTYSAIMMFSSELHFALLQFFRVTFLFCFTFFNGLFKHFGSGMEFWLQMSDS